jgi:hypothetical protein
VSLIGEAIFCVGRFSFGTEEGRFCWEVLRSLADELFMVFFVYYKVTGFETGFILGLF